MSSPTKLRQMAKELGWPPELEKAADQLQKLKRENAALRADKYRLDWLDEHCELMVLTNSDGSDLFMHNAFLNPDKAGKLRSVIDAYRKEAQS